MHVGWGLGSAGEGGTWTLGGGGTAIGDGRVGLDSRRREFIFLYVYFCCLFEVPLSYACFGWKPSERTYLP